MVMTEIKSRPCHPTNYRQGRPGPVEYLVLHYVGAAGTAEQNAAYYGSTADIGASAHYFVGHGGEIWQSVEEQDTAWHCGAKSYCHSACRNGNAIGVELCCRRREGLPAGAAATQGWYFEPETVDAAVELCRDIVRRYGLSRERVLRHYDVTGKVCPAPFVYDGESWEAFLDRVFAPAEAGPAHWAHRAWERARSAGALDGTRPGEPVTRQELAVVLDRLGLLK